MSEPRWIDFRELTHGQNTQGYIDIFNRPNRDIWALFGKEHEKSGLHISGLKDYMWKVEEGSYVGNGTDNRDIALANTGLYIKILRIWTAGLQWTYFRTYSLGGDNTKNTGNTTAFQSNYIQWIRDVGQFQVGTALNSNGITYYYVAYGVI